MMAPASPWSENVRVVGIVMACPVSAPEGSPTTAAAATAHPIVAIVDRRSSASSSAKGSVALLVGGIGVANTMVISVLERRREIGLRRALDATRGHIRTQFLAEALLLSLLGGIAGVVLGLGVTGAFAVSKG